MVSSSFLLVKVNTEHVGVIGLSLGKARRLGCAFGNAALPSYLPTFELCLDGG